VSSVCRSSVSEETCGSGGGSRTLKGLLSPADFLTGNGFRRPEAGLFLHPLPDDPGFGSRIRPFLLKFCSYFPYNAKLCLNGHEHASGNRGPLQRQKAKGTLARAPCQAKEKLSLFLLGRFLLRCHGFLFSLPFVIKHCDVISSQFDSCIELMRKIVKNKDQQRLYPANWSVVLK